MKKYIFTAALTVLAAAACSKENIENQEQVDEVRGIEVSANVSEATRTTIDGVNVLWAKGDKVGFIADAESVVAGDSFHAIKDEFDGQQSAKITVPVKADAVVTDGTEIAFTAYYPYSAKTTEGGRPVAEIATEQDGQTGEWGYMSAKFSGTVASLAENGLTFEHSCAYIDFQLKSSEHKGCPVTEVKLISLDGKFLTGEYGLTGEGALSDEETGTRCNYVSLIDPVESLSGEWQGKVAVVVPVNLTGTKVMVAITYTENGADCTQTKIIDGSNLAEGHKVTLKLNLDKTDFNVISFEDTTLGEALATAFGSDGYLTVAQAAAVDYDKMNNFVSNKWPSKGASSFHEFQYFSNVTAVPKWQGKTIRKITLPNSINVIKDFSFMRSGLGEINNTSQVTYVGYRAFNSCSSLKSIDLGNVTTIGGEAFYKNTNLESVGDTKCLTSIDAQAFSGCSSLKKIDLSNLTTVGAGAFNGCSVLTEINSSLSALSEIPDNLFATCFELEAKIELPEVIGNSAFSNCRKIEIASSDFEKVTSIGYGAFQQCWKITGDLRLGKIETLGYNAFQNTKITSVDMSGAPLEKIDNSCFKDCTSLKTVTISERTTTIGYSVFSGCENISEYHILSKNPATVYSDTFAGTKNYSIYVPKGYVDIYKAAEGWKDYADRIKEEQ